MTVRTIEKTVRGRATEDGAGVKLVRVIARGDVYDFDPFLMLDAFDSANPEDYVKGFPWHPHRGIETVTYLAAGEIEHGDSLGSSGCIRGGDCQWMTAGSGIIHQEMPQPSPHMFGLQFWLNLPEKDKMTSPKYHDITANDITVVKEPGAVVRIISGFYGDKEGAMQPDYVKATFLDVELEAGAEWGMATDPEATVFLYILSGGGVFAPGSEYIPRRNAVLFASGDEVEIEAGDEGTHFVLCMGRPLGEPIAWGGPIVMNTEEELQRAFDDLREGTFIKSEGGTYRPTPEEINDFYS